MEAELWFLLFYIAKLRGARTMLINARISDRSWESYRRFSWFYRKIFDQIDEVYAQSDVDKESVPMRSCCLSQGIRSALRRFTSLQKKVLLRRA